MGDNEVNYIPAVFLWLVAFGLSGIILWDTYCMASQHEDLEITELLFRWSIRWPFLPFAAGLLMGHLFWRK